MWCNIWSGIDSCCSGTMNVFNAIICKICARADFGSGWLAVLVFNLASHQTLFKLIGPHSCTIANTRCYLLTGPFYSKTHHKFLSLESTPPQAVTHKSQSGSLQPRKNTKNSIKFTQNTSISTVSYSSNPCNLCILLETQPRHSCCYSNWIELLQFLSMAN